MFFFLKNIHLIYKWLTNGLNMYANLLKKMGEVMVVHYLQQSVKRPINPLKFKSSKSKSKR